MRIFALVFVCSERASIVIVTGTCRFADHARFGRFNKKISEKRLQKFEARVHSAGSALGLSDAKNTIQILDVITTAEQVTIQILPFSCLPTNATFYPSQNTEQVCEILAIYFE